MKNCSEESQSCVTPEQIELFRKEGYLLLENVINSERLELLREECRGRLNAVNAEMDRLGVESIRLNHRDKRYSLSTPPLRYLLVCA